MVAQASSAIQQSPKGSSSSTTSYDGLNRASTGRRSSSLSAKLWILRHVFPDADVPVEQLSIDATRPAEFHYDLGKRRAPLREEGVFVVGSGNLVHNLHAYAWGRSDVAPLEWATRFEAEARRLLEAGIHAPLVHYESLGRDATLAAPTPDHYLPLLYVIALQAPGERVSFPITGFDGGSVSMLTVRIG